MSLRSLEARACPTRPLLVTCASIALLVGACGERDSGRGASVALPPGDRDAHGPLPETVAGYRVTRGAAAGYVDDTSCETCHEEIYKSYQQVGMGRSFYRADPKKAVEKLGEEFFHQVSKRYYQMVVRDGRYVLRRYCKDDDGKEFAQYEATVEWVIGSGNHVRTYISRSAYGELFELPLSWYAKGVGWGMSPGYDMPRHHGFGRRVDRACLFCHNAYPELPVGGDRAWAPQVFPAELPHGIGCQRCHGPGARHVEAANDEKASEEKIRSRIVNPGRFPIQDQHQLCMTCHLQPESLFPGLMPMDESRLLYQHRPQKKITDFLTYLDHGTEKERANRFEVNHHGYRLRQSKCFTASEGKLACVTCHDPHRKVPKAERASHYRQKCFGCHEVSDCRMEGMGTDVDAKTADCVACHMVRARPSDVVKVTVTDHLIRRRPPERDLTAPIPEVMPDSSRMHVVPYFEEQAKAPRFAMREGIARVNSAEQDTALKSWYEAFERLRPHPAGDYINVGWSLLKFGDGASGAKVLAEGVEKFPDNFVLRWAYAEALLHHHRSPAGALAQLQHAFQLAPDNPDLHKARGDVHTTRQDWPQARDAYQKALHLRPTDPDVWTCYVQALVRVGDLAAAERAVRELIALDPDEPIGYGTLMWLFERTGDHERRVAILRQAASRLTDFALQLVLEHFFGPNPAHRDPQKGLRQAQRAVAAYPNDPRSYLYLATAIFLARAQFDASEAIQAGRARGGDLACTAGLMGLDALYRRQWDDAERLFHEFERLLHLQSPRPEPLRQVLRDFIRSHPPISALRRR